MSLLPERRLASLTVGPLSFGTVKIGRNVAVKNKLGDGVPLPSDKEVRDLLAVCREYGVRLLDTAPAYGIAEERLGKLMGPNPDDFLVATKVGETFDGQRSHYDFSANAIRASVENSLRKLQRECLEFVVLHCPREDLSAMLDNPAFETLELMKQEGKVRHFGASVHSVEGGLYAVEHGDIVMLPYNQGFRVMEPVLAVAAAKNVDVLAIKVLQQGHLGSSVDPVRECLEAVVHHSFIASSVIGTTNIDHLRSNLKSCAEILGDH